MIGYGKSGLNVLIKIKLRLKNKTRKIYAKY